MGTRTDEAERRLRAQRELIEHKLDQLEQRAADDMSTVRARITERVTRLPDALPGATVLLEEVSRHPFTTLAGAAGAGVALGLLSEGFGSDEDEAPPPGRRARGEHRNGDGGMTARALSALGASLLVPLRSQVEEIARDAIAGFSDRARGNSEAPRSANADGRNGEHARG